jgi:hypothetical protein
MSRIYKEMPIAFPFYEVLANQDRYRENVEGLNQYALISPNNALLPFQIEMPVDKSAPTSWHIINSCSSNDLDISNNLEKIKVYEFGVKKQAVYKGEILNFTYQTRNEELNLPAGSYFTVFNFADGSSYTSEVFTVKCEPLNSFIKIDFWNDTDIKPILYRDNFLQTIYLDTFVSSYVPEIEEETEKDGFNNKIPVFQKLVLRYKIIDVVPDFLKIALISLQMHDHVVITTVNRSGEIDRLEVTAQPHEGQGINDVEILFEDDMLYKTNCQTNETPLIVTTW